MKRPITLCVLTILALLLVSCACTKQSPSTPPPQIVSRADWKAHTAIAAMQEHKPVFITIHHTGTPQKPSRKIEDKLLSLQQFSQREDKLDSGKIKPAWPDVPYHFYIDCHGQIAEGREIQYVGDTNTEYDPTGHILVVLEGNFENEVPSAEQLASMQHLVAWLSQHWHISSKQIKGHQDYAKTQCPGKNLESRLVELRASLDKK